MNGYILFLIVLLGYLIVVYILWKYTKLFKNYNLSFFAGPILMLKTMHGLNFIKRVGEHKKFWKLFGTVSIILITLSMFLMVGLLVWEAFLVFSIPVSRAPSPDELLGLPGINPVIPVVYGIVALIIAVVIHELFHGFVAKSFGLKIKSIGVLYFILPIGAFVETDDEELRSVSRSIRSRVAAAGPSVNLLISIISITAMIIMLSFFVKPIYTTGVPVAMVYHGSAAEKAGIQQGDLLMSMNNIMITNYTTLLNAINSTRPGSNVTVVYWNAISKSEITEAVIMSNRTLYTGELSNITQRNTPFFGVGIYELTPVQYLNYLKNPVSSNFLLFIALPFLGLEPVPNMYMNYYHISIIPQPYFWFAVNLFYWLFWLDLMLAMTNALPAYPLDGSYLYIDGVTYLIEKAGNIKNKEEVNRIGGRILAITSVIVFGLIIWQIVGPHIF